ncbi:hypothetical protein [Aphanizomenon sp. UHCC 0183]|jgi:hypothetical protein|nr:hypothetical protein [Aphanizomenon sp. UHCC 0183]MBO1068980.1 hypothetical protein [Dolichospermum sp. DEX189]
MTLQELQKQVLKLPMSDERFLRIASLSLAIGTITARITTTGSSTSFKEG